MIYPHSIVTKYAVGIPVGKALDIGAGRGDDSYYLAKELGFQIDAIDSKKEGMVHEKDEILLELQKSAQEESLPIFTHEIDIRNFPLQKNTYSLIIAMNSLQFLREDVVRIAPQLIDALVPGGRIIISMITDMKRTDMPSTGLQDSSKKLFTKEYIAQLFSSLNSVLCEERVIENTPHIGADFPHTHTVIDFIGDKK